MSDRKSGRQTPAAAPAAPAAAVPGPGVPRRASLPVPWRAIAATLLLGAVLGAGVMWLLMPKSYSAEARIAVGDRSLKAAMVPGYADAAATLAEGFARYVTMDTIKSQLPAGVTTVEATAIPNTPIIRVQVSAKSQAEATSAANAVAKALVASVTAADSTDTQQLQSLRASFVAAQKKYSTLQATATRLAKAAAASPADATLQQQADEAYADAQAAKVEADGIGAAYQDAVQTNVGGHPTLAVVASAVPLGASKRPLMLGAMLGGGAIFLCWALYLTWLASHPRAKAT